MHLYPPTPLPCLRGRRKGRAKHCPWQHRSCGQPCMFLSIHGIHSIHVSTPRTPRFTFFVHLLGLKAAFLVCLRSALGGVCPFRIRCWRVSFWSLSRLGCATGFQRCPVLDSTAAVASPCMFLSIHGIHSIHVSTPRTPRFTFFVHLLGLKAAFLACLSSDSGGLWVFRIQLLSRQRLEGLRTHRFWLFWARI